MKHGLGWGMRTHHSMRLWVCGGVTALIVAFVYSCTPAFGAEDPHALGTSQGLFAGDYRGFQADDDWVVGTTSYEGVVAKNLVTQERRVIQARGMNTTGHESMGWISYATVGSGRVVWSESWDGAGWELCSYELATSVYSAPAPYAGAQAKPTVAGDWMLYSDDLDFPGNVHAVRLSTGVSHQLTAPGQKALDPVTDGFKYVWRENTLLRVGDIDGGSAVVPTGSLRGTHAIDQGRVVYTDFSDDGKLMLWDTTGNSFAVLASIADESVDADISGDWVVWEGYGPGSTNKDIFAKNITTGELRAVCRATGDQVNPRISGTRVVWRDTRSSQDGGTHAVYGAQLSESPVLDLTRPTIASTETVTATAAKIAIAATDHESGVWRIGYRNAGGATSYLNSASSMLEFKNPGQYSITYWAEDMQGNRSTSKSLSFTIKATPQLGKPSHAATAFKDRALGITGGLTPGRAVGSGSVRVYRWRRSSTGVWEDHGYVTAKMATPTTYATQLSFPKTGSWRLQAYAPANALNFDRRSEYSYVTVRNAVVGSPVAPTTMRATRKYVVYGSLDPRHDAGTNAVRIYKWRKVSGKWRSDGYVKASVVDKGSISRYQVKLRLSKKGSWRLRAYAPANAKHLAAWSKKYDYVTVK